MNFAELVMSIKSIHQSMRRQAGRAVNVGLTMRNWLIGRYIAEYELNGEDRAEYGEHITAQLALRLKDVSNCSQGQLYRYIRFFRIYPQILSTLSSKSHEQLTEQLPASFSDSLTPLLIPSVSNAEILGTAYSKYSLLLLESLSYSHFEHLSEIEDDTKRLFYEVECLKGVWTVRELKRQIGSQYYERSGKSYDKVRLSELVNQKAERLADPFSIRDPYIFEFIGLQAADVMSESKLESQLMKNFSDFILELGFGFCFEARQKRILIGGEYYYVEYSDSRIIPILSG